MSSIKEKIASHIHQKGWSIPETAKRADLPVATIKSIIYGEEGKGHRTSTLEKLAKAFDCSVASLVSDESDKKEKLDVELFKECLDAVKSYCERKEIACDKNKMVKIVESLVSLYGKKKSKGSEYSIDDDTIEWLMGNH